MQFSDALNSACLDLRCFCTTKSLYHLYIKRFVESGNRRRGKGARRKSSFRLCFIALKGMSFCTFRGVAPAGPQHINYSLGKSIGFARGNPFAEGQNH